MFFPYTNNYETHLRIRSSVAIDQVCAHKRMFFQTLQQDLNTRVQLTGLCSDVLSDASLSYVVCVFYVCFVK